jgi:hypothetical protein
MKRVLTIILFICAFAVPAIIIAQAPEEKKEAVKETAPAKDMTAEKKDVEKKSETGKASVEGYGKLTWGTLIEPAKDEVVGKVLYTDEKKVIITRDGDLEYLYGFFYRETPTPEKTAPDDKATETRIDARLFYVSVRFPYLALNDVKKKIEDKYGPATGETLKNNQGAIIWDSKQTTVVLWVDQYEKKPFCRKISYVGKEIAREVNDYQRMIFNATEIEVLKRLQP